MINIIKNPDTNEPSRESLLLSLATGVIGYASIDFKSMKQIGQIMEIAYQRETDRIRNSEELFEVAYNLVVRNKRIPSQITNVLAKVIGDFSLPEYTETKNIGWSQQNVFDYENSIVYLGAILSTPRILEDESAIVQATQNYLDRIPAMQRSIKLPSNSLHNFPSSQLKAAQVKLCEGSYARHTEGG